MTTTGQPGGTWVQVGDRQDWVPDEQPGPSPDGSPGRWHVVIDADGSRRWEWHEAAPPPPPPPAPIPQVPPEPATVGTVAPRHSNSAIAALMVALAACAVPVMGVAIAAGADDVEPRSGEAFAVVAFSLFFLVSGPALGAVALRLGRRARREMDDSGGRVTGEGLVTGAKIFSVIALIFWGVVCLLMMLIILVGSGSRSGGGD